MNVFPHVAIAILNYNGKNHLQQFLPSVLAIQYPNFSVWVIDNSSSDDSITFLKQFFPSVQIVQNGHNLGFAAGYNQGLHAVKGDYFFLLNSDVALSPQCLQPMVEMLEKNSSMAFLQPRILNYLKPDEFEYAGAGGGRIDILGYPFCRGRIFETVEPDAEQYNDDNHENFWASGAAMMVRPSAYYELGGLYPPFFMHNEEIDLCWRAQAVGWSIGYCGESVVFHLGGGSLAKESPRKTYYNFRNNLIMLCRNMPMLRLIWVLIIRLALDVTAALQMMLSGKAENGIAVLKAWLGLGGWWLSPSVTEGKWPGKRAFISCKGVYRGSIVWQHFVRGKNKFSEL